MRIGQLTDVHVRDWSDLTVRTLASKRASGALNYLMKRRAEYQERVLNLAIERLIDERVDHVIVSGDLSNLALNSELRRARQLLEALPAAGIPVAVIPGNHDRYHPDSLDGRFERVFDGWTGDHVDLENSTTNPWPRVVKTGRWHILLVNSAVPTPWFEAWGRIGDDALTALDTYLSDKVGDDEHSVIAVHHHPSVALYKSNDETRNLRDADELRAIAVRHGVPLIMHGHNHYYDVRTLAERPKTTLFGLSSSISSTAGDPHRSGQLAIHTLSDDGGVLHEVASWTGEAFSDLHKLDPETIRPEQPDEVPS